MSDYWSELLDTQEAVINIERQIAAAERRRSSQERLLSAREGLHGASVERDDVDDERSRQVVELLKDKEHSLYAELDEAREAKSAAYLAWARDEVEKAERDSLEALSKKVADSLAFIVEGLAHQFGSAIDAHNADVYALLDLAQGVAAYDEISGAGDSSSPVVVLADIPDGEGTRRRSGVQIDGRSVSYVTMSSAYAMFSERVTTAICAAIDGVVTKHVGRTEPFEEFNDSPWHLPEGMEQRDGIWELTHEFRH